MTTMFDIGDDIEFTVKGKVLGYCLSEDADYFKVKLTNKEDDQAQGTFLYLSTRDLLVMNAQKIDQETGGQIIDLLSYSGKKKMLQEMEDKDG